MEGLEADGTEHDRFSVPFEKKYRSFCGDVVFVVILLYYVDTNRRWR
jgi:hypothetical protein